MTEGLLSTWLDQQKARLEREYPDWQVWYVMQVVGGVLWCARRDRTTLNCGSVEELEAAIG